MFKICDLLVEPDAFAARPVYTPSATSTELTKDNVGYNVLRRVGMFEGLFQPMHLLVIFLIALLVFGPKRLGDIGKGLGEGIRSFKSGFSDDKPEAKPTALEAKPPVQETKPPAQETKPPSQETH